MKRTRKKLQTSGREKRLKELTRLKGRVAKFLCLIINFSFQLLLAFLLLLFRYVDKYYKVSLYICDFTQELNNKSETKQLFSYLLKSKY